MSIMLSQVVLPQASNNTTSSSRHLKQKRARSQLSCAPCRTGKLKCNRANEPACDQCLKRSRGSSCIYLPPAAKHKPAQNVKGRIQQLESLVVDLMNNTARKSDDPQDMGDVQVNAQKQDSGLFSQPTPPSDSDISPHFPDHPQARLNDVDSAAPLFGQMRISKDEISYVGEGHWGAILDSISALKRDLSEDEDEDDEDEHEPTSNALHTRKVQENATTGLGFLLGINAVHVTKEELIANLPEKKVADRLLSLWFNSPDPFKPIIHAPTFQEQYRQFWVSPKNTPVMWLGLLYSIMSLATSFGLRDSDHSSPQAQSCLARVNRFHGLAASAAVLADFSNPKEHTIECLFLYAAGLRSSNAYVNVWLMVGIITRLALRMGYHRDAANFPAITAFHGEMRRRTWALITMIDVLISFQLGLPSMVKNIQSDSQPPQNLLDRDFSMDTKILPPGRGIDELTPCSYTRVKLLMVKIFADAAELSHATVPPAHEELMALDNTLEEAKAAIPPLLQMPEISELVTDPAEQLMCRFNLDLLYLKTKLTLHRRYQTIPLNQLSVAEQRLGVGHSRVICSQSALRVLLHHHTIHSTSQPGGQLESVKWYMGSLSTHDFLLAAMIICLELSLQMGNEVDDKSCMRSPLRNAMMEALENSQKIWAEANEKLCGFLASDAHSSGEHMLSETAKASRAMSVMIRKVKAQSGTVVTGGLNRGALPAAMKTGVASNAELSFPSHTSVDSWSPWENASDVPDLGPVSMSGQDSTNSGQSTSSITYIADPGIDTMTAIGVDPQATSLDFQIDDADFNQMDYSMLDAMLDPSLSALDWEMWDQQIGNGRPNSTPWLHQPSPAPNQTYNLGLGTLPLSETAILNGENGTINHIDGLAAPGAEGIDFPAMEDFGGDFLNRSDGGGMLNSSAGLDELDMGMLQDVQLDMALVMDHTRNGMYPATKDDWVDFRQRGGIGTKGPAL